LEEYLKDPNFEQNRREYKANKLVTGKDQGTAAASSGSNPIATTKPVAKVSFAEVKKPEKGMFDSLCQIFSLSRWDSTFNFERDFCGWCSETRSQSSNAGFLLCD
jgi:hypothetical protein